MRISALIPSLIRAVRFGRRWAKAQDLASRHDYTEALKVLKSAYQIFGDDLPSKNVSVETNVLAAVIAAGIDDNELALKSAQVALEQLDHIGQTYNVDTLNYLVYYCNWMVRYCKYNLCHKPVDDCAEQETRRRQINFKRVRGDIKKNFPIAPS